MLPALAPGSSVLAITSWPMLLFAWALPILTAVTWLLYIRRLVQRARIPTLFWAELIIVTAPLILTFAHLLLIPINGRPQHYMFRSAPWFWLYRILPAILPLPAAFVYRQLPSYLLTSGAAIQITEMLVVIAFYRGGGIA